MTRAWLTPDVEKLSAPDGSRLITIPNELWPYLSGALFPLTEEKNWEQFGTATPADCASLFRDVLLSFDDYEPQGGAMNFIPSITHNLISAYGVSGNSAYPRYNADLPAYAQAATSILVAIRYGRATGSSVQQLLVSGIDNSARTTYYDSDLGEDTKGQCWVTMSGGGAMFRLIGSGNTADLEVNLIGWQE